MISNIVADRLGRSPAETAIGILCGKWKVMILTHLMQEMHRFNELQRLLPNISQRMLTNQLRELEADGLVHREVYAEVPPRVEYSLTKRGYSVRSVLDELKCFGKEVQVKKISNAVTYVAE